MHDARRTNTQGKVQKYKSTKVWGEGKGKTSQATKGTNTKSHTQTQECKSEARRRPKAPKQRSNAMRQARDKQHSSSGAATAQQQRPEGLPKLVHHINPLILRPRRTRSACAGSRDTTSKRQSCKNKRAQATPPRRHSSSGAATTQQLRLKCSFYHSCRIWCIRTVVCKCKSVTSVLS